LRSSCSSWARQVGWAYGAYAAGDRPSWCLRAAVLCLGAMLLCSWLFWFCSSAPACGPELLASCLRAAAAGTAGLGRCSCTHPAWPFLSVAAQLADWDEGQSLSELLCGTGATPGLLGELKQRCDGMVDAFVDECYQVQLFKVRALAAMAQRSATPAGHAVPAGRAAPAGHAVCSCGQTVADAPWHVRA